MRESDQWSQHRNSAGRPMHALSAQEWSRGHRTDGFCTLISARCPAGPSVLEVPGWLAH